MQINNATIALCGIIIFGIVAIIVAIRQMKVGFGKTIFGIILVATCTTALAIVVNDLVASLA